jgi:hypothetical protein
LFQSLFFWKRVNGSPVIHIPYASFCFNPCFSGRESTADTYQLFKATDHVFQSLFFWKRVNGRTATDQAAKGSGFNPCFSGRESTAWAYTDHIGIQGGFNPCFSGRESTAAVSAKIY